MNKYVLILFFLLKICNAQVKAPFTNNGVSTKFREGLDEKERCNYYVLFLGAINDLRLPYEYRKENNLTIKISHGELISDLDYYKSFKWKVCDTLIDSAYLLIYKKKKLFRKISCFINKNRSFIKPFIFKYNCFHTSISRNDSLIRFDFNDTTNYCYKIDQCPNYEIASIKLLKFDIIVFNSKGDKDSIIIRNKNHVISNEFFEVWQNIKNNSQKNKLLFCNFYINDECLNKEYYLDSTLGYNF